MYYKEIGRSDNSLVQMYSAVFVKTKALKEYSKYCGMCYNLYVWKGK